MTIPKPPSQPGCAWVEECVELCKSTAVFVEERGVRATFRNPKKREVSKIHYDGCYQKDALGRRADFILCLAATIDIIVELKGSDSNLSGSSGAYEQVENTLMNWRIDDRCGPKVACLIVHGRISVKKKLPGRIPRASAQKSALESRFLNTHKILLLIHEAGEKQFSFNEFLQNRRA